jgi:hypothetical protein
MTILFHLKKLVDSSLTTTFSEGSPSPIAIEDGYNK